MEVCPNHPNRKVHTKGLCGSCYDKDLKSKNPEYRQRQINNSSQWMKLNIEKRKKYTKKKQESRKNDPTWKLKCRERSLKKKYKITLKEFDLMNTDQNGKCAICFKSPSGGKPLHVDHCHKTNRVRGLLCHQCNWYMGLIDADRTIIERLFMYGGKKNILEVYRDGDTFCEMQGMPL